MQKHMEDGGDINILFSSEGSLIAVCNKCKKVWMGNLTVTELPIKATAAFAGLGDAMRLNLPLLKKFGIDLE